MTLAERDSQNPTAQKKSPMTVKAMITTTSPKGVNSGFAFFRRRIKLSSLSLRIA
jgi:hypothetical protein